MMGIFLPGGSILVPLAPRRPKIDFSIPPAIASAVAGLVLLWRRGRDAVQ